MDSLSGSSTGTPSLFRDNFRPPGNPSNLWGGAQFNMTGVETPPANIPSLFQGMVSGSGSPPAASTPGLITPPAATVSTGAPPAATPPVLASTMAPATAAVGSTGFFVSGLGRVPSLNDFLQFMSYSNPRQQGLHNILSDRGIFDQFAQYLQPGHTPGEWATGELGAYGPSHNLNPATGAWEPGSTGTFSTYDPEGLMNLLSQHGIITGYTGASTGGGGTVTSTGGMGGTLSTIPAVNSIQSASDQLRTWDWSQGLPPVLQPGNALGQAMGWGNVASPPTQFSGWGGSHPIWGEGGGATPPPTVSVQPEGSTASTEPPGSLSTPGSGVPPGWGTPPPPPGTPPIVGVPGDSGIGASGPFLGPVSGEGGPAGTEGGPGGNAGETLSGTIPGAHTTVMQQALDAISGAIPAQNPWGTGIPQPHQITDPSNPAYGANHELGLEDLSNPGLSTTDRQYLAGLSYYFNPTNYQAWQNALAWGVPGVPPTFNPTPGGAAPGGMYPGGGSFVA